MYIGCLKIPFSGTPPCHKTKPMGARYKSLLYIYRHTLTPVRTGSDPTLHCRLYSIPQWRNKKGFVLYQNWYLCFYCMYTMYLPSLLLKFSFYVSSFSLSLSPLLSFFLSFCVFCYVSQYLYGVLPDNKRTIFDEKILYKGMYTER